MDFVLALEGSDTDQGCVSPPQGHCLAPCIIIVLMAPHLLLLKEIGLSMGPPNVFPQFLDVLGGSGHGYQSWGKSKSDIDRELGLSPVCKEIGAETHGVILGPVVSME